MSTTFNPDGTVPSSVEGWTKVAVASSTNSSPIIITATGHGFNNGDTVGIEGHTVNTAANGLWVITYLSTNAFSLNGSTGNGTGTTTGYALDYSVLPQLTLPSDGDLVNASAINTPIEGSSDTIPWMYKRVGRYAVYDQVLLGTQDSNWTTGPTTWLSGTQPANSSWNDLQSLTFDPADLTPLVVQRGDILVATFTTTFKVTAGVSQIPLGLGIVFTSGLGSPGTATIITGSAIAVPSGLAQVPISITAFYIAQASDANKRWDISLMMHGNAGSPDTYAFCGDRQLVVQQYRSNV